MPELSEPTGLTTLPYTAHPVRTERLLLRPLTEADVDDVFAYQSIPDVVRHLPWPLRTHDESREHTVKRAGFTRLQGNSGAIVLAAELVGPDGSAGRVIGDFSIILQSSENAQVEVGWVLHPDYQGKGYATEGASAILDLAFGELGAHRVRAELDPANTASAAVCRRLGMRHEAHFVECEIFKGGWGDLDVYAILDREWTIRPS
jgi:RimJ/RimL family protein N-acetyltransferase